MEPTILTFDRIFQAFVSDASLFLMHCKLSGCCDTLVSYSSTALFFSSQIFLNNAYGAHTFRASNTVYVLGKLWSSE